LTLHCSAASHRGLSSHYQRSPYTDPASTGIHTLPLPDALPISPEQILGEFAATLLNSPEGLAPIGKALQQAAATPYWPDYAKGLDRKSTRLNSSHVKISYAVFCLKKKK